MRAKPWGEPTLEVIAGLRPAWWIARAALLGLAVAFATNTSFGGAVFLLALVPSVWLGRKAASGQVADSARMAVLGANAALAVGGAFVVAAVVAEVQELRFGGVYAYADDPYLEGDPYAHGDPYAYGDPYAVGFSDADGMPVENIFAYGPDGSLLQNVRLYDQRGRPIELPSSPPCEEDPWLTDTYYPDNPWGGNLYPRMTVRVDDGGTCREPVLDPPHGTQLPDAAVIPAEPGTADGTERDTAAPTPGGQEPGVPGSTPEPGLQPSKGS